MHWYETVTSHEPVVSIRNSKFQKRNFDFEREFEIDTMSPYSAHWGKNQLFIQKLLRIWCESRFDRRYFGDFCWRGTSLFWVIPVVEKTRFQKLWFSTSMLMFKTLVSETLVAKIIIFRVKISELNGDFEGS